jgi:hypothetical protein
MNLGELYADGSAKYITIFLVILTGVITAYNLFQGGI